VQENESDNDEPAVIRIKRLGRLQKMDSIQLNNLEACGSARCGLEMHFADHNEKDVEE
jgi:hypothetical protein